MLSQRQIEGAFHSETEARSFLGERAGQDEAALNLEVVEIKENSRGAA